MICSARTTHYNGSSKGVPFFQAVHRLAHKSMIRTTTYFFMTKSLYEFF
ncbi:hypothetical protein Lalb_Chr24g0401871 [Lupinus albus]|uniref:Uncharacterized protein n=1 Tax=Lupinus albus TaxID=3870 RepID=A0A6A4N4X9_LUPAL|nr:hypothetical protein Lalb_Chr24g0401871 [Lupinus albus]